MLFSTRKYDRFLLPGVALSAGLHLLLVLVPGKAVEFLLHRTEPVPRETRLEILPLAVKGAPIYKATSGEEISYRAGKTIAPLLPALRMNARAGDSAFPLKPIPVDLSGIYPPETENLAASFTREWEADSTRAIISYISRVFKIISLERHYPEAARLMGHEGKVEVGFAINRHGGIKGRARLVDPSPYALLNRAACRSVQRSAPFPPLPECLRQDTLSLRVKILYELE